MIDKKSLQLLAASSVVALACAEIGLRIFTGYPSRNTAVAVAAGGSASVKDAAAYVDRMAPVAGIDPAWFLEAPEPLKRTSVDPQVLARFQDYQRRGIYPAQAQYVFNRLYVTEFGCAGAFQRYPQRVGVFESLSGTFAPRYRFLPDMTMPDGLVTNHFGFRGPAISLKKPDRTIRIAFAGASTTVNSHDMQFSFPEYAVHWLNRYAQASGLKVNFEVINAGREGLGSRDIAAIVREEVVPLDPDLVLYYEGANQFYFRELEFPGRPPRAALDPKDAVNLHKMPAWFRNHFALGDLIDRALAGFVTVGEPAKPLHAIRFPSGVSERHPDPDTPNLPLGLHEIVPDLDSIRGALNHIGGELAVASFVRLAGDGLLLSPARHKFIYEELNNEFWPLRYADIRRLTDFENRAFRAYADKRHVFFVDVAGRMPQDPALFSDAVHMVEVGERLKAWIVFEQLAPHLRAEIESGRLPRSPTPNLPPPPPLNSFEVDVCPK